MDPELRREDAPSHENEPRRRLTFWCDVALAWPRGGIHCMDEPGKPCRCTPGQKRWLLVWMVCAPGTPHTSALPHLTPFNHRPMWASSHPPAFTSPPPGHTSSTLDTPFTWAQAEAQRTTLPAPSHLPPATSHPSMASNGPNVTGPTHAQPRCSQAVGLAWGSRQTYRNDTLRQRRPIAYGHSRYRALPPPALPR